MTDVANPEAICNFLDHWLDKYRNESDTDEILQKKIETKVLRCVVQLAPVLDPERVDGHLRGQAAIIDQIEKYAGDEDKILDVAMTHLYSLLIPIKVAGGRTELPIIHRTRKEDEECDTIPAELVVEARGDQKKMKKLVSRKSDLPAQNILPSGNETGWRAMCYNAGSGLPPVPGKSRRFLGAQKIEPLVLAYVMPFFLIRGIGEAQIKRSNAVWATITTVSRSNMEELNGDSINRVNNVLILSMVAHSLFGSLDLRLEAIENEPTQYKLKNSGPFILNDVPTDTLIEMINRSDDDLLEVPNRRFLQLHTACAKIVQASGAAEIIDQVLLDYETMTILALDGASQDMLGHALRMAGATISVH